jgi:hypothetical protein
MPSARSGWRSHHTNDLFTSMDPGYRSPLVDLFLKGEAAREIRLMAARGVLPRPAHEQIALLVVLSDDADPEIAATANATMARLPPAALTAFLTTDAPAELRAFFSARGAELAAAAADTAPPDRAGTPLEEAAKGPTDATDATEGIAAGENEASDDPQLLSSLSIAQRLKLATKGTREQRGQLIRDSNRIVATAVLTSPKLTESEVEAFAKMGNVSEDVLRIIGTNRNWLKNYGIVHAVTRNPKTPTGISMQLMHRLTEKDIKMLTTDRNVPEALRQAARRTLTKSKHG